MESPILHRKTSSQELFRLERFGRYSEAIQLLETIWKDKSALPNLDGFGEIESAEILLRCGSLIGFLGHTKQIPSFQEHSRNILTKARENFLDIYDPEKIAECENHLALTYTRKGETSDAQIWVDSAYSHNLSESSDARLYSHLIQSIITNTDKNHLQTIENFKLVESAFREFGDDYLNGAISANLGTAYKVLGDLEKSIDSFVLSRFYYKKAQNEVFLGAVENDIAMTYSSLKKYSKAHQAVDNALDVFQKAKDRTKYAFTLDTKALIYLDERNYQSALDVITESVEILEKSEDFDYLVETLSTKTKVLVKLNKIADAAICLARAVEFARINISQDKVDSLATDFEKWVNETKTPVVSKIYVEREFQNENIELVIPSELSHFEEIEGVWIKNKHLEELGLKKNSLGIISKEEIKRGDLVAVLDRETEEVICGFYDLDFGIVCLEVQNRKLQLFDECEIQILGKIIGVAEKKIADENKMFVEPILAIK